MAAMTRMPWDPAVPEDYVSPEIERAVAAWLDANLDRIVDAVAERVDAAPPPPPPPPPEMRSVEDVGAALVRLDAAKDFIRKHVARSIEEVMTAAGRDREYGGVVVGGVVTSITIETNQSGDRWSRVAVQDRTGAVEVVFYPQSHAACEVGLLSPGATVAVKGRRDGGQLPRWRLVAGGLLVLPDPP